MCSITIRKVESKDSAFLCALMNHPALMHRLHQTATTNKDWTEAIQLWFQDEDEQDYILCDRDWPIGWFGVNGLQATDKKAYLKIAVLLPEYQGKGIGSSFLSDLLVELKAAGYSAGGLGAAENSAAPSGRCRRNRRRAASRCRRPAGTSPARSCQRVRCGQSGVRCPGWVRWSATVPGRSALLPPSPA